MNFLIKVDYVEKYYDIVIHMDFCLILDAGLYLIVTKCKKNMNNRCLLH